MKNVQLRNSFLLLLTAFIWGTSFVAQSVGTDYVQPFTFNGIRSLIGSLVLLPCIAFLDRKTSSPPKSPKNSKDLILGGTLCGILLFAAANFQQFGIHRIESAERFVEDQEFRFVDDGDDKLYFLLHPFG